MASGRLLSWCLALSFLLGCAALSQEMRSSSKGDEMFVGTVVMIPAPDTIWAKGKDGKVKVVKLGDRTRIVKDGKEAKVLDIKKGMEIRVLGVEEDGRIRAFAIAAGTSEETIKWLEEMATRGALEYGGGIGAGE